MQICIYSCSLSFGITFPLASHPLLAMSKIAHRQKTTSRTAVTKARNRLLMRKTAPTATVHIIQNLREGFGVNQNMLVRLSGYSPRAIINWAKGTKVTKPAAIRFKELHRLFEALAELTQDRSEVTTWLETPNQAFEGSTPLQVIERGESDRLWRMIYHLRSGEPG